MSHFTVEQRYKLEVLLQEKVNKTHISVEFKTQNGAQIFAVIRSVTDTCIKNGQNVLEAFKTIATLQAE